MNHIAQNHNAWNQAAYDAWINRFGTPEAYADKLKKSPETVLNNILEAFGDVKGKKILNLMGSNGNKAVALALLGADVTVIDFSNENKKYAMALANACGVTIEYIVSDVLSEANKPLNGLFDIVFSEMGILHYFLDLHPFFKINFDFLKVGGKAFVKDFHPVSTKLISSKGSTAKVRKHKVTGDYFSEALESHQVAYDKYTDHGEAVEVFLRKWTLGEIVTASAKVGFVIAALKEYPNQSSDVFDAGIPKTFLLCLNKRAMADLI